MFQYGKVLKVFRPEDKEIEAGDKNVHALLEMWDEIVLTALVQPALADKIKSGEYAVTEIVPISQQLFRHVVVKLLRGKIGEDSWKTYKELFAKKQKEKQGQINPMGLDIPKQGMVR